MICMTFLHDPPTYTKAVPPFHHDPPHRPSPSPVYKYSPVSTPAICGPKREADEYVIPSRSSVSASSAHGFSPNPNYCLARSFRCRLVRKDMCLNNSHLLLHQLIRKVHTTSRINGRYTLCDVSKATLDICILGRDSPRFHAYIIHWSTP